MDFPRFGRRSMSIASVVPTPTRSMPRSVGGPRLPRRILSKRSSTMFSPSVRQRPLRRSPVRRAPRVPDVEKGDLMAGNRRPRRKPATTDDGREGQLVSSAIDLAERQIQDGTASSQVITHFLKLGSTRERLEQERLKNENSLLKAKVESLKSQKKIE